jgi:F0F1-type ATP synthase membrane subunit b/b'
VLALDLDVTYLFVLALFLVPLVVLNGLLFGPFLKLFEERHEKLTGALARAEAMLAEAEERALAFAEKIQIATARGIKTRNRLRLEAAEEMNRRIEAERAQLAKRMDTALTELKKTRMEALADVHVEAARLGEATAAKLLGRGI